jgi:endonuclease/exonuclease/phosphatase family metal-dependent hydrolase
MGKPGDLADGCGKVVHWVWVLILSALPAIGNATEIKIATWNLNWLTTRLAGDRGLPADVKPRGDDDFAHLAEYARELNADLVAFQEVDGFAAATKIFNRDQYSIHLTHDHVVQRVGIAVRRGLKYDVNPDVVGLSANHLRSGADITVHFGAADLRILAVHLKTGCPGQPLAKTHDRACLELRDQIPVVSEWIAARQQEGVPFVVLGDFNRRMNDRDAMIAGLRQSGPLVRATEGQSSPCWGAEDFIDHILAGGGATGWMEANTLRVLVYKETDPAMKDRLSDHCPVSIRFMVPD